MGAAVYGGRGFKGKGKGEVARGPWAPPSTEGEGSKERGKGKWREAHGRRRLQTAIQPGVMQPPLPLFLAVLHVCFSVFQSSRFTEVSPPSPDFTVGKMKFYERKT